MRDRKLESLITNLSNALGYVRLYPIHSSLLQQTLRAARGALQDVCRGTGAESVRIDTHGGQFVGGGSLMIGATISGYKLIEVLRRSSAGALIISRQASPEDLAAFLRFGSSLPPGGPVGVKEAQARLESLGCRSFEFVPTEEELRWFEHVDPAAGWEEVGLELGESVEVYQTMFENVEGSMRLAANGASIDMNEARTVSERLRQSVADGFDNAFQLANCSNFDSYTVGHSIRVALLAVYVASRLDAPSHLLTEICAAGLMHDVGKGRIPHEILYKPDMLDEEERRIISEHPLLGAEILIESEEPSPCALGAAWGHHLRFDGSGYPPVRPWAQTTRVTSLIQVCDVFEALTAERPYKPAMAPACAYEVLFQQSGAFDPAILSAFTRALGLYPPGRFVRLSDDRLARVRRPGESLDRPSVRLLPSGTTLDLESPEAEHLSVAQLLSDAEALDELELESPPAPLPSAKQDEQADPPETDEPDPESEPPSASHSDDCRLC